MAPEQNGAAELLIAVRPTVTPRDVEERIVPIASILRHSQASHALLVMAPWIAPRAQQQLRDRGIGYLDLTGNVSVSVPAPAIRLSLHGALRSPYSQESTERTVTLAGPRAGRIVRFLADFVPPYRAGQIADACDVSLPWVSRLLRQLEDQLLIRREGRVITEVRWAELLRARAETCNLLRNNAPESMLAPEGITTVLDALKTRPLSGRDSPKIVVTGPYAAREVAPLTVGGQLMLYVDPESDAPEAVGHQLGLLRVDQGADVLLLRAQDRVVFARPRTVDGIAHVALSQLVLDGLAGPGRMPAEAEGVLAYMAEDETRWRRPWVGGE
ncbi:MAG: hypothetical protein GEU86_01975 [Actinophytocola sp.]|nr:hypothetical protein [Actinophytocola sp.]